MINQTKINRDSSLLIDPSAEPDTKLPSAIFCDLVLISLSKNFVTLQTKLFIFKVIIKY